MRAMKIKCPSCCAEFDLIAALDSVAGSQLLQRMAALEPGVSRPLLAYLSLFRSPKRALSWDKALRLSDEVLALSTNQVQLSEALQKVVDALREKQQSGGFKPLKNHNYLKRVLEDSPQGETTPGSTALAPVGQESEPGQQSRRFTSKTANGMMALQNFKQRR